MKLIAFEGSIGSGKTTLTNFFAHEFRANKILEGYGENPFLSKFYKGNVDFETEMTFLMIHYYQIRTVMAEGSEDLYFTDFSIEKDLVYARMNLEGKELSLFQNTYDYIIGKLKMPDLVIYIDISDHILRRRIFQRGRDYEMSANMDYFNKFSKYNRNFFVGGDAIAPVVHFNVDDLILEANDAKLSEIRDAINQTLHSN